MAETNSTVRTDINTPLDAIDALNHVIAMTNFLQDVLTQYPDGKLPDILDTSGLYFILNDIKDRIFSAKVTFESSNLSTQKNKVESLHHA